MYGGGGGVQAGKMALRLRALGALPKNPDSSVSIQMVANSLYLQFQGTCSSLLATMSTAQAWCTDRHAGKILIK